MDTENIHIIDEAYGFKSGCYAQTREGILFSVKCASHSESYILKPCIESADRKIFTYAIHAHLNGNGFQNTDRILKTSGGGILLELCGRMYTCSRLPQGRQCCVENDPDLKSAAALLAAMHNASLGFTAARAAEIIDTISPEKEATCYVKNELGSLLPLYEHRSSELCRFKRLASRSRGRFDYEYLSIADYYCGVAADMCTALAESQYAALSKACAERGAICHRDYASHNIVFFPNALGLREKNPGTPADLEQQTCCAGGIMNFDCAVIDLPLFDITNLIKRRMRKCGWRSADADAILNSYCKIRQLSESEIEIIKIILTFPQKLWRIVNKYYNSRRSWCEKSCLLKLSEIKKERAQIDEFIKSF